MSVKCQEGLYTFEYFSINNNIQKVPTLRKTDVRVNAADFVQYMSFVISAF